MASKSDEYYDEHEEDDEEEDEGDFVPGGDDDDDDELDGDFDDENLDDDEGDDSPFLSGLLYLDGNGKIVFESPASADEDQQAFCFSSEEKAPESWGIPTPLLKQPLVFTGTLHGQSLKLNIGISEYDTSGPMDALDERFLKIQDDLQPLYMDDSESKKPAKAKADDEDVDADSSAMDSKKPARRKAGEDDEEEDSKPVSRKASPMSSDKHIYVLNAEQTSSDKNGTSRTIRGVFRIPEGCSRILVPAALNIHATSEAASPSGKASAAAAVAKKRSRDDDEDEGDDGVGYQELIDLHDDAGLSTEELRRRYYGGTASGTSGAENKKAKTAEEDDDDDAYGF